MTSDTQPSRRIGRSIGAVLAGIFAGVILTIGTDLLLHAIGIFPALGEPFSDSLLLIATVYRTIYGIVGAYVTARLAPNHPMGHALAGGALGLVVGVIGAATHWNSADTIGHRWYPVALVVLALPGAWVGAKIQASRTQAQASCSEPAAQKGESSSY